MLKSLFAYLYFGLFVLHAVAQAQEDAQVPELDCDEVTNILQDEENRTNEIQALQETYGDIISQLQRFQDERPRDPSQVLSHCHDLKHGLINASLEETEVRLETSLALDEEVDLETISETVQEDVTCPNRREERDLCDPSNPSVGVLNILASGASHSPVSFPSDNLGQCRDCSRRYVRANESRMDEDQQELLAQRLHGLDVIARERLPNSRRLERDLMREIAHRLAKKRGQAALLRFSSALEASSLRNAWATEESQRVNIQEAIQACSRRIKSNIENSCQGSGNRNQQRRFLHRRLSDLFDGVRGIDEEQMALFRINQYMGSFAEDVLNRQNQNGENCSQINYEDFAREQVSNQEQSGINEIVNNILDTLLSRGSIAEQFKDQINEEHPRDMIRFTANFIANHLQQEDSGFRAMLDSNSNNLSIQARDLIKEHMGSEVPDVETTRRIMTRLLAYYTKFNPYLLNQTSNGEGAVLEMMEQFQHSSDSNFASFSFAQQNHLLNSSSDNIGEACQRLEEELSESVCGYDNGQYNQFADFSSSEINAITQELYHDLNLSDQMPTVAPYMSSLLGRISCQMNSIGNHPQEDHFSLSSIINGPISDTSNYSRGRYRQQSEMQESNRGPRDFFQNYANSQQCQISDNVRQFRLSRFRCEHGDTAACEQHIRIVNNTQSREIIRSQISQVSHTQAGSGSNSSGGKIESAEALSSPVVQDSGLEGQVAKEQAISARATVASEDSRALTAPRDDRTSENRPNEGASRERPTATPTNSVVRNGSPSGNEIRNNATGSSVPAIRPAPSVMSSAPRDEQERQIQRLQTEIADLKSEQNRQNSIRESSRVEAESGTALSSPESNTVSPVNSVGTNMSARSRESGNSITTARAANTPSSTRGSASSSVASSPASPNNTPPEQERNSASVNKEAMSAQANQINANKSADLFVLNTESINSASAEQQEQVRIREVERFLDSKEDFGSYGEDYQIELSDDGQTMERLLLRTDDGFESFDLAELRNSESISINLRNKIEAFSSSIEVQLAMRYYELNRLQRERSSTYKSLLDAVE